MKIISYQFAVFMAMRILNETFLVIKNNSRCNLQDFTKEGLNDVRDTNVTTDTKYFPKFTTKDSCHRTSHEIKIYAATLDERCSKKIKPFPNKQKKI